MAAFKVLLWCVLAHFCPALGRDSNCPGGKCGKKTDHVLLQRKASSPALDRARCAPRAFLTLGYGNFHLGQCEGDCNHDDDCSGSLRCMQRSGNEDVPGCNGLPFWGVDYCYDPACEPGNDPLPSPPQPSPPNEASSTTSAPPIQQDPMIIAPPLDSSYGQHGSQNMPKCAGDCDTDSQCAQGLSCFQRDGTSPVPGCWGTGEPNFDYCYDPNDASTPSTGDACLCVFDIDRTLTGAQGTAGGACPSNLEIQGVRDDAYWPAYPGWLTISDLGQKLQETFCNECFLGIVSHGDASGHGSPERDFILKNVLNSVPFRRLKREQPEASVWSSHTVSSPLVLRWPDKLKQDAVSGIVRWYGQKGVTIAPEKVHFFGDRTENIGPFGASGFNSREISCASRDYNIGNGMVGYCGATLDEIVDTPGVSTCNAN
mmetsp:Transcript_117587/g.279185  ORF Transcript_117587/g.279185 Transcript_117587/m.279185 type:complete len:428 (+) Transcript_117587:58-1341(+)